MIDAARLTFLRCRPWRDWTPAQVLSLLDELEKARAQADAEAVWSESMRMERDAARALLHELLRDELVPRDVGESVAKFLSSVSR